MKSAVARQELHPRSAVARMREYHPPLAGRDGLRLDFNENTLAPSPRVEAQLRRISAETLTRYPERTGIEQIVARYFRLAPEAVLLTNGVDEAIHLMCETYLEPSDDALIVTPTFAMYALYAEATGATIHTVQSDETLQFPYRKLQQAIDSKTRLIMLASPNNPTGAVIDSDYLIDLAKSTPHAALLVDEAYFHFHDRSVLDSTVTVENLFVARTFSKAYGLAGLRIGLLAGNPDAMRYVRKVSSPYNVNSIALECLPDALADEAYITWYVSEVDQSRSIAQETLRRLNVPFWPSHANFILMRIGDRHSALVEAVRRRGVLLRDRSHDPGCNGCVRITLGTVTQTRSGLEALEESLEEIKWQPEK